MASPNDGGSLRSAVRIRFGFLGSGDMSAYIDKAARTKEQTAIQIAKDALRLIMFDTKQLAPSASQRAEWTLERLKELVP